MAPRAASTAASSSSSSASALAIFWSGFLRVGAQSALLLAPLVGRRPAHRLAAPAHWASDGLTLVNGAMAHGAGKSLLCGGVGRSERVIVRCVNISETARGARPIAARIAGLRRAPERCQPWPSAAYIPSNR